MQRKTKAQKFVYWMIFVFYMAMMFVTFLSSNQINKLANAMIVPFALVIFFIKADFKNLFYLKRTSLLLFGYYFLQFAITIFIWVATFTASRYISYTLQKFVFRYVCIFACIGSVYLFQNKSVDYTFYAAALTIGYRIVKAFIANGVAESLNSIQFFFSSGGEQITFMKDIEVHEMTYTFGLFFLYYVFFNVGTKKGRIVKAILALFLFLSGWKRIGAAALVFAVLVGLLIFRINPDKRRKIILACCIISALLWFLYVPIIKYDVLTHLMDSLGINMQGRDSAYDAVGYMYEFSPTFKGYGYDYLGKFLMEMYDKWHVDLIHNDIVKTYIELGFFGCAGFLYYRWVFMNKVIYDKVSSRAGTLYFLLNIYSFITYAVGNTNYSYVVLVVLWTIILSSEYYNKDEINDEMDYYIKNRVDNALVNENYD